METYVEEKQVVDRTTRLGLIALLRQANEVKQSLAALEHEIWRGANWQTMIERFGVILVQMDKLHMSMMDKERFPHLEALVLSPGMLSTDPSNMLAKVTEGRLHHFTHDIAPTILRTKVLPEMEAESALASAPPDSDEYERIVTELKSIIENFISRLQKMKGGLSNRASIKSWFPDGDSIQPPQQKASLSTMLNALNGGEGQPKFSELIVKMSNDLVLSNAGLN